MFKLLLLCTVLAVTLTACDKQKQASTEVGAIPKQVVDKATNDINNAEALIAEKMKAAENLDSPESVQK